MEEEILRNYIRAICCSDEIEAVKAVRDFEGTDDQRALVRQMVYDCVIESGYKKFIGENNFDDWFVAWAGEK